MAAKQENMEGIYFLGRYYFEGLAGWCIIILM
jgi:hypothetical protein